MRRGARVAVPVILWEAMGNCGFSTDPAERPLEGVWLGAVSLIVGGLSWQLWQEAGQSNVTGWVSRTDFRRIPPERDCLSGDGERRARAPRESC